ncbi:hypothetical protein [Staphylococcus shinii]|uniref:hypothetical protein n=1 Tax=Staphylococcus shinii TaxID=2912228 RepID=UPI000853A161|nr:hypothetical protein [Staphylococcus shinii]MBO3063902.1 hypothetical protein [Staphylococcus shinii]OEK90485.1 hypothetical protein AST15_01440 [Staphylococcus shinii]PTH94654.1 hypothetical protein BU114_13950 [Staphylococcus shinii]PTI62111.1 hypothetical protein BU110_13070 [Staphylococcus shinii]QRA17684.1 hypothetical protein JMB28_05780 [Staphylococcus shinii]
MHDFNYNDTKELELNAIDIKDNKKRIEWIYANYENITLKIQKYDMPWLIMNGYQIARIENLDTKVEFNNLKVVFDFTNDKLIYVTYSD